MAVVLYCGWDNCRVGYAVDGMIPVVCPACERETKWVVAPFAISLNDRKFLKSIKIDPN